MELYDSSTWKSFRKRYSAKIGRCLSETYPAYVVPPWIIWIYRVDPGDEQGMKKSMASTVANIGGFERRRIHIQVHHDRERRIDRIIVSLRDI